MPLQSETKKIDDKNAIWNFNLGNDGKKIGLLCQECQKNRYDIMGNFESFNISLLKRLLLNSIQLLSREDQS